jgi:hypothetical protein
MQHRAFISYSHRDDRFREQLVQHLSPLIRSNDIDLWDDRRIAAGDEWRREVDLALSKCDLALLLVSKDFLSSTFCRDKEVPDLLKRHETEGVRIVPIILRPCLWKEDPLIVRFKALPPDGKPVTQYRPQDLGFTEVARAIAELLKVPAVAASPSSTEDEDYAAFVRWWEQIDAAWPGDKGLLCDELLEQEPQRRSERWKQVEAVLEEFAALMGRRSAAEIVCRNFWYTWDDEPPTSLNFIQQKLARFRKVLSSEESLPPIQGNEGWYRMRWESFTGGERHLEIEHEGLQDLVTRAEVIGRIFHTPTEGPRKGERQGWDIRQKDDPDNTRASIASGKPTEVDVRFHGAFSRLDDERKQAWRHVKSQLEEATLAELKRRWGDLLAELRKGRRYSLGAILVEAVPVALRGDTLTLSFARNHEFHYTKLSTNEKYLKATSDALKQVVGREFAIACQLENANAAAADQPA